MHLWKKLLKKKQPQQEHSESELYLGVPSVEPISDKDPRFIMTTSALDKIIGDYRTAVISKQEDRADRILRYEFGPYLRCLEERLGHKELGLSYCLAQSAYYGAMDLTNGAKEHKILQGDIVLKDVRNLDFSYEA